MRLCFEVSKEEAGIKLGPFLRRQGLSASLIRSLKYESEGLQVGTERAKTNRVLQNGETVCVQLPREENAVQAEEIPLEIVYEDEHVMVLNKPAGLVMHPTRSHKGGTLANGFAYLMNQRKNSVLFRPIGRLDANTSGLVLCAMNACVAPQLFSGLEKVYLALLEGVLLEDGCVSAPLMQRNDSAILQCVNPAGKPSQTQYAVLAYNETSTFVALRPKTGRTHQIRVHMAHIGHPLLGDDLYGGTLREIRRHALHCAEISFYGFQKTKQCFVAQMPRDMKDILRTGRWNWSGNGEKWRACQSFDIIV